MLRATSIVRKPAVRPERVTDRVTLDHEGRNRRRIALKGEGGLDFLLDLERATVLNDGDAVKLEDGRLVQVQAAPQRLLEVRAENPLRLLRMAWHIGNRHAAAEITADALYIEDDPVLAEMVRGQGGTETRQRLQGFGDAQFLLRRAWLIAEQSLHVFDEAGKAEVYVCGRPNCAEQPLAFFGVSSSALAREACECLVCRDPRRWFNVVVPHHERDPNTAFVLPPDWLSNGPARRARRFLRCQTPKRLLELLACCGQHSERGIGDRETGGIKIVSSEIVAGARDWPRPAPSAGRRCRPSMPSVDAVRHRARLRPEAPGALRHWRK